MEKVRFGIVGCGNMGTGHSKTFREGGVENGVLTAVCDINPKKLKRVRFILKNTTKIFLSAMDWGIWRKKGMKVNVLQNIEIAAITVNPWAPSGYTFDREALMAAMKEAIPALPIIDVRV